MASDEAMTKRKLCYRHFGEDEWDPDGETLFVCIRQGLTTNSLGYCEECWQDIQTYLAEIDETERKARARHDRQRRENLAELVRGENI